MDTSAELVRVSAELDALKGGARLVWLPEFGEDEEIALGEPTVHNHADGRFVLRRPVTEATEQAEPRKSPYVPLWSEKPCERCGCDACSCGSPATPTEPRVWREGDDEPFNVGKVRDKQGDVWTRTATVLGQLWTSPDTRPFHWSHIAKKWGPLTEVVVEDEAGGGS